MRKLITILALIFLAATQVLPISSGQTYCNPLNISYRFGLNSPSFRVAADPVILLYKENYYLFATQSGGYWYSSDLLNWNFVTTPDLPFELDAPAAAVIGDSLYYIPINSHIIYRAKDPIAGKWEQSNTSFPLAVGDPDIFQDTDGRVYYYYGCSNNDYIRGVELDVKNKLNPKGITANCFKGEPTKYGWERPGDYNTDDDNPWIEGPWMTKYNGRYYLQHAAPATQNKSYGDGYYVSNSPLGPFTYAVNNPFCAKPEGFIDAAGHGATFADKYGNWWHIATMSISVKHMFERRLGLFPVTFDNDGNMVAHTEFGDLPMIMPDHKYNDVSELFPGWMMLSYKKTGEASSSLTSNPISYAFDENVRDYWSAKTGAKGEWLSVDLGSISTVNAVQLNFAENNTQLFGRLGVLAQQYLLEYSTDKVTWNTLVDKTTNTEDLTHQYHIMNTPVSARYLKVTNYRVPGGTFAISGFRVFGAGTSSKPTKVSAININMLRDENDSRTIKLQWRKQPNAIGYNIRFGSQADKLYRSYQVYSDTALTIRSLDLGRRYWFAVDAFGENGVTSGDTCEGITSTIAGNKIEAESYNRQLGITRENCAEGGLDVTSISEGDYTNYSNVDFGTGVAVLDARVASGSLTGVAAGSIEIREDSIKGPLLGTVLVVGTGNLQNWKTVSCNLTGANGVHNLYLVYRKTGFSLNWIKLRYNSNTNQVSLYQKPDFTGWSANFGGGSYSTASLESAGAINNNTSSIKVPIGWTVMLYDGDEFTGAKATLTSDNANLLTYNFIDRTTSMKVVSNVTDVVSPIEKNDHLRIFPNPISNNLFITGLQGTTNVSVFDLSGKQLIHTTTSGSLDVSGLARGVYILRVSELNNETFKIVKL